MPIMLEYGNATTFPHKLSRETKVLLMCEDPGAAETWSKLLNCLGCTVQSCSHFVELFLYLGHESFHLAIIVEGDRPNPGWRTAAAIAAEGGSRTPFFVINRKGEAFGISPSVESVN